LGLGFSQFKCKVKKPQGLGGGHYENKGFQRQKSKNKVQVRSQTRPQKNKKKFVVIFLLFISFTQYKFYFYFYFFIIFPLMILNKCISKLMLAKFNFYFSKNIQLLITYQPINDFFKNSINKLHTLDAFTPQTSKPFMHQVLKFNILITT
jgi:hypothetical protein